MAGSTTPDFDGHFPAADLASWEQRFLADLNLGSMTEASWGPPGAPPIAPLLRGVPGRTVGAPAGWRLAEFIDGAGDDLGQAVASAREGGVETPILNARLFGTEVAFSTVLEASGGDCLIQSKEVQDALVAAIEAGFCGALVDPFECPGTVGLSTPLTHRVKPLTDLATSTAATSLFAIDLEPWEKAGASISTLVAVAFARTADWLELLIGLGLSADRAASKLRIIAPVGHELFHESAKLRALRSGVSQIVAAFGSDTQPGLIARTSRHAIAAEEDHTNLIRTSVAAVASVIGGADLIAVRAHDERTGQSEAGRRLARNIAHLLRHECHWGHVADPGAGSHYLESATTEIGRLAWSEFQSWEKVGGLTLALGSTDLLDRLDRQKEDRERAVSDGEIVRVGVNKYVQEVTA